MPPLEWPLLRWPLALLLGFALFGGALLLYSQTVLQQRTTAKTTAEQALTDIQQRYEESQNTLKIIQDFYPHFEQLQAGYALNSEKRLMNLLEQLQNLREELMLPGLSYETQAQQAYVIPGLKTAPGFQVYLSELTLRLSLLHDDDLINLLKGIQQRQPAGLFGVKRCEITRTQPFDHSWRQRPGQANLEAVCVLQWYSFKLELKNETQTP